MGFVEVLGVTKIGEDIGLQKKKVKLQKEGERVEENSGNFYNRTRKKLKGHV